MLLGERGRRSGEMLGGSAMLGVLVLEGAAWKTGLAVVLEVGLEESEVAQVAASAATRAREQVGQAALQQAASEAVALGVAAVVAPAEKLVLQGCPYDLGHPRVSMTPT